MSQDTLMVPPSVLANISVLNFSKCLYLVSEMAYISIVQYYTAFIQQKSGCFSDIMLTHCEMSLSRSPQSFTKAASLR